MLELQHGVSPIILNGVSLLHPQWPLSILCYPSVVLFQKIGVFLEFRGHLKSNVQYTKKYPEHPCALIPVYSLS